MKKRLPILVKVLIASALVSFFLFAPKLLSTFYVYFLMEIMIWGLLAMSLNLILGYLNLVSFGHAAIFGSGAYAAAFTMTLLGGGFWQALGVGIVAAALVAWLIGFFSTRVGGIAYIMVTLIFCFSVFLLAMSATEITGGENGIYSSVKGLEVIRGLSLDRKPLYYVVFILTALSFFLLRRIVNSPFGRVLIAIRENEERVRFMGYRVKNFKLFASILSGAFAGLAGVLYFFMNSFVSPEAVGLPLSTEVVVWCLVGGTGTMLGPIVGTALMLVIIQIISTYTKFYLLFVGIILVLVVAFMPEGVVGFMKNKFSKE